MDVRLVDSMQGFPREPADQVRVLTVPDPTDSRRMVTNVLCRYRVAGQEVSFRKNPHDSEESFEDALNWAKSFARLHGIDTVYAANMAAG